MMSHLEFSVLESFVLQNLLDGDHLSSLAKLGLVDDPEAAVANHLKTPNRQASHRGLSRSR